MSSKKSLVLFAAVVVLLAGAPVARAGDSVPDERSGGQGLNEHQTELDEQYARSHPTTMPGTPARPSSPYGYVPPHHAAAKHRHGVHS
jgi:hypothetical protein